MKSIINFGVVVLGISFIATILCCGGNNSAGLPEKLELNLLRTDSEPGGNCSPAALIEDAAYSDSEPGGNLAIIYVESQSDIYFVDSYDGIECIESDLMYYLTISGPAGSILPGTLIKADNICSSGEYYSNIAYSKQDGSFDMSVWVKKGDLILLLFNQAY